MRSFGGADLLLFIGELTSAHFLIGAANLRHNGYCAQGVTSPFPWASLYRQPTRRVQYVSRDLEPHLNGRRVRALFEWAGLVACLIVVV